jgi:hypothetical protein
LRVSVRIRGHDFYPPFPLKFERDVGHRRELVASVELNFHWRLVHAISLRSFSDVTV